MCEPTWGYISDYLVTETRSPCVFQVLLLIAPPASLLAYVISGTGHVPQSDDAPREFRPGPRAADETVIEELTRSTCKSHAEKLPKVLL